jgi:hypothetical protein
MSRKSTTMKLLPLTMNEMRAELDKSALNSCGAETIITAESVQSHSGGWVRHGISAELVSAGRA